jgi:hypothetical protein
MDMQQMMACLLAAITNQQDMMEANPEEIESELRHQEVKEEDAMGTFEHRRS